jgi:hypothetical protein
MSQAPPTIEQAGKAVLAPQAEANETLDPTDEVKVDRPGVSVRTSTEYFAQP